MAKTRRKKQNRSPGKAYRNAKTYIAVPGDRVVVKGFRAEGPQVTHKPVGDRKARPIFVGRQYTGVARSKVYPTHGKKRGGVAPLAPVGLMARAAKAVKRVYVMDAAVLRAIGVAGAIPHAGSGQQCRHDPRR